MSENLIVAAREQVAELTMRAYLKAASAGALPLGGEGVAAKVDIPKDVSHGDYACSFAMAAAKTLGKSPRDIAQAVMEHMELAGSFFDKVEMAGPGFLNFTLGKKWFGDVLAAVESAGMTYGAADEGHGRKVNVEFVSANPTGPMHIGNARGGVLGDTIAAVLERLGYTVCREFYVNDAGNQIHKFAMSIDARYRQIMDGAAGPIAEDLYQGEDIKELAQGIYDEMGDKAALLPEEERLGRMAEYGLKINKPKMKAVLEKYGIHYDQWFLESTLHDSGAVAAAVEELTAKGYTYEQDGALWLNTTKLLKEKHLREGMSQEKVDKLDLKDDVLRRANGFYTYFAADIAYHRNKLSERGFGTAIDVWGADHHGHIARLQAALDGLGLNGSERLVVVLMQLVNLLQDGKPVRMSKRTGKAIALHDLLDEISVDAARFVFSATKSTSPLDFDLDLAVRQDSENPVYYVQYAHARICSLAAKMKNEEGMAVPAANEVDAGLLQSPEELALLKTIARFPEEIKIAGRDLDPSQIDRYLIGLAGDFHRFYNANRIKGEEPGLAKARLKLADTARSVLANGLGLLGVNAPEKM